MEPKSARDYDDVGAQAVLSVLLEIGQVLGVYRDRFVVIGGSVPWLLFPDAKPAHVGTLDIDLSLDAQALGEGDYKNLVESLEAAGYQRAAPDMKWFQLRRTVEFKGHAPITVLIDLLMPREAKFKRNKPPLLANFAVQKVHGAGVAMHSFVQHRINGTMPDGRPNSVELRVASIPALLVMKGYALAGRDKHKDAYDIYFSVREFEGGPDGLANACRQLLDDPIALAGFKHIASKFTSEAAFGPMTVRQFLGDSAALGHMTADQVQVDAFRQVKAWLDRLGICARPIRIFENASGERSRGSCRSSLQRRTRRTFARRGLARSTSSTWGSHSGAGLPTHDASVMSSFPAHTALDAAIMPAKG